MKVLHVLESPRFSGAENVVCQIIDMCKSKECTFAYASRDGQIREALKERDIEFHPIDSMSVSELRRVFTEVKPDIIHAHDMRACFFAALACGRTPLIAHVHNNNFDSRGLSLKSCLFYLAARKAKHIFWVSQSSFDGYAFHNSFTKKSTVLYNIIDIEALKKKAALDVHTYDYELVYLGRLSPPKNPHRLIEVFRLIADKRPLTKMAIIGTGDLEDETKQLVIDKGLSDNVTFLGFQSNPSKMLQDAKVMIMTSRWEGTPMCALEAMALGVPIVSTPTDGLCELVVENETGYLSDENECLAQRCVDIISDVELHERMSVASVDRAHALMDVDVYKAEILGTYGVRLNEK